MALTPQQLAEQERMKLSVGNTAAGSNITVSDPRVQALVSRGLSVDAAIGSVVGSQPSPSMYSPNPSAATMGGQVQTYNAPAPTVLPNPVGYTGAPAMATTQPKFVQSVDPDQAAMDAATADWLRLHAPQPDPDANTIYQDKLKTFQQQIDATNQLYNDQLNKALAAQAVVGKGRVGQNTAIQARSGQLGSDFGAAATDTINTGNMNEANAISDEISNRRRESIASLMGEVRKSADSEFQAKTVAQRQGADALVAYYEKLPEQKAKSVKNVIAQLLGQDIDPSQMTPEELNTLAAQLKVNPNDIIAGYKTAKQEDATAQAEAKAKLDKTNAEAAKLTSDSQTVLKPGDILVDAQGNTIGTAPERPADPSKPMTEEVNGTLLQYNPATDSWNPVFSAPTTSESDKLLTPNEAAKLGVPYGTTRGQAASKTITPAFGRKSTGSGTGSAPVATNTAANKGLTQKKLDTLLKSYPAEFKQYISSIAAKTTIPLTAESIYGQFQQYNDLKSQGELPGGRKVPVVKQDAKTITTQNKSDLTDDIKAGNSLDAIINAYPDVSDAYIRSLYTSLTKK